MVILKTKKGKLKRGQKEKRAAKQGENPFINQSAGPCRGKEDGKKDPVKKKDSRFSAPKPSLQKN